MTSNTLLSIELLVFTCVAIVLKMNFALKMLTLEIMSRYSFYEQLSTFIYSTSLITLELFAIKLIWNNILIETFTIFRPINSIFDILCVEALYFLTIALNKNYLVTPSNQPQSNSTS